MADNPEAPLNLIDDAMRQWEQVIFPKYAGQYIKGGGDATDAAAQQAFRRQVARETFAWLIGRCAALAAQGKDILKEAGMLNAP